MPPGSLMAGIPAEAGRDCTEAERLGINADDEGWLLPARAHSEPFQGGEANLDRAGSARINANRRAKTIRSRSRRGPGK